MSPEKTPAADQPVVAFVANTSWYLWNFRRNLARALADRGAEVVFVAPRDDYSERLAGLGRYVEYKLDRTSVNPLKELLYLLRLWRLVGRISPGIILSWTPKANIYCGLVARARGIRFVPNISGLGTMFIQPGLFARLIESLYRLALGRAQTVFFQNNEDLQQFVVAGIVTSSAAVRLPGSGVDLKKFTVVPIDKEKPVRFVFASRLLVEKGLPELVQAVRSLRQRNADFCVDVYGAIDDGNPSGIPRDVIQDWEQEGVINYHGAVDTMPEVLKGADCAVLPSYYREGVPRILLEALASGRPVITCDVRGCRDTVSDTVTGFLCTPKSADSLAHAMQKFMNLSLSERSKMGDAARAKAEAEFDENLVLEAYARVVGDNDVSDDN